MTNRTRPITRSELMSRIRSKDTKPELVIRRGLHARGLRFRLHRRDLPGTPDLVLRRSGVVVEVRGCFWHGHENCARQPKSRQEFWGPKLARNRERDAQNLQSLHDLGWRVVIVWECTMVGCGRWDREELLGEVETFIHSTERFREIAGH
ncbi:very short patch repair endonuclease [Sulfitobacter sabulilitoris]|uniref:DNA mismatch endonuclease Vsr n=1 Tax=Sulfitobacter sabulilitoris TaxID=2562655 RepID=A0A5S3PL88_9RHOB|nr:very short patch repair endonuclease [Sulfitobacter sabulilitoris]TMM55127.1 DNA mismatch endonuclease Vsr [Sulfitobacter sabulilitoris]